MDLPQKRSLVERFWSAWETLAWDAMADLLDAEVQWDGMPGHSRGSLRGRDAVLDHLRDQQEDKPRRHWLVEAVVGPWATATYSNYESDHERNASGYSFHAFLGEHDQITRVEAKRRRSQVLHRAGIDSVDRRGVFVVRGWDDPRLWRVRHDDPLVGRRVRYQRFEAVGRHEHDHCTLCTAKVMDYYGEIRSGYVVLERQTQEPTREWICEECFDESRDLLGWTLAPPPAHPL